MSVVVGSVPNFSSSSSWTVFEERLDQWFVANKLDEESQKVAILLTLLDEEVYTTLRNLLHPDLPKDKSYKEVGDCLRSHFSKHVNIFRERKLFYEAKQLSNESVTEWIERLKSLVVNCSFGGYLSNVLRDKFVTGITQANLLDRMCEEKESATFEELCKTALQKEAIDASKSTASMFKVSASKGSGQMQDNRKCFACGKTNHNFKTCNFKNFKCSYSRSLWFFQQFAIFSKK